MRALFIVVGLLGVGGFLCWRFGVFDVTHYGERITRDAGLPPAPSENHPSSTGNVRQSVNTMPPKAADDKKPKRTLMYTFTKRIAPSLEGERVDAVSNSVIKEVDEENVQATIQEWRALDQAPLRRRIYIEVIELTDDRQGGFSLSQLATSLVSVISQTSISSSGVGSSVTTSLPTSIIPVTIAQTFLPAVAAFLTQAKPSVKANDKIATGVWLTNGIELAFTDFSEQQQGAVTTTTTSTTQAVQTREVGFNFSIKGFISTDGLSLNYKVRNTQPTTNSTAEGESIDGETFLSDRPVVLVDSVQRIRTRGLDKLLGIPVGFASEAKDRCDLIIIAPWRDSTDLAPVVCPRALPVLTTP